MSWSRARSGRRFWSRWARRWGDVHGDPRVAREPGLHTRVFVGGVGVRDKGRLHSRAPVTDRGADRGPPHGQLAAQGGMVFLEEVARPQRRSGRRPPAGLRVDGGDAGGPGAQVGAPRAYRRPGLPDPTRAPGAARRRWHRPDRLSSSCAIHSASRTSVFRPGTAFMCVFDAAGGRSAVARARQAGWQVRDEHERRTRQGRRAGRCPRRADAFAFCDIDRVQP